MGSNIFVHVFMTQAAIVRYAYEYGARLSSEEVRRICAELTFFCKSWGDRDGAFMDYLARKKNRVQLNNDTVLLVVPLQRDDIIAVAIKWIAHPKLATKQQVKKSREIVPDYHVK